MKSRLALAGTVLLLATATACTEKATLHHIADAKPSKPSKLASARPDGDSAAPPVRSNSRAVLTMDTLRSALITSAGPGFTKQRDDSDGDLNFCGYKARPSMLAGVAFFKGDEGSEGMAGSTIRQFDSDAQAKAAFERLAQTLETCHTGNAGDGPAIKYSPLKVPQAGQGTIGIRSTADGFDLLQAVIVDGPSLLSVGVSGGIHKSDPEQLAQLMRDQTTRYETRTAR